MKPEQQRNKIAKACGWIQARTCHWEGWWYRKKGKRAYRQTPPDHLNDLNAMHEAEEVLTKHQWDEYERVLRLVCDGCSYYEGAGKELLHATAAQRAEAFLRTLGLWEVTQ